MKSQKLLKPWHRLKGPQELRLVRSTLALFGTPRALSVWLLFESGHPEDLQQMLDLDVEPRPFETSEEFASRYAPTKLLSKSDGFNAGIDRRAVALMKAQEAEGQCARTNEFFRSIWNGTLPLADPLRLRAISAISAASAEIERILGPCPTVDDLITQDNGWSPGRTTSAFGTDLSAVQKYSARTDVTLRCARYAKSMLNASPQWAGAALNSGAGCSILSKGLEYVEGNTMTVVPKNAKTDRVICYEPHLNIRPQLAVGAILKQRLTRAGCNLRDQSRNQSLARLASKTGHLATIDLRSASDTLAKEVVFALLPREWAELLDDLRSHTTMWPDGRRRKNHKFSSMGNGFTFELETLVFLALLRTLKPKTVSVYGDDIIIDSQLAEQAISLLRLFGFETNTSKTFTQGPFRESCGDDAMHGCIVTPPYIRNSIRTVSSVVHLHNAVRRWLSYRSSATQVRGLRLLAKWRKQIPFEVGPSRCGSRLMGDEYYHVEWDEASPTWAGALERWRGWEGWVTRGWHREYLDYRWDPENVPEHLALGSLAASLGPRRPWELEGTNLFGRYRWKLHLSVKESWDTLMTSVS